MRFSFPLFKSKGKATLKKKTVQKKKKNYDHGGGDSRERSRQWYSSRGMYAKPPRNNLQDLYKRKSRINQKLRVRKYKLRVTQDDFVRRGSIGLSLPKRPCRFSLILKRSYRVTYTTLIGMEKAFMQSRGAAKMFFRKYPNFFVTKKSSKSRMGKGKGKIAGRIMKLKRGQAIVDVKVRNFSKKITYLKYLKALRAAIPYKTRLIYKNKWVEKNIRAYKSRRFWSFRMHRKKRRKHWEKMLEAKSAAAALLRKVPEGCTRYRQENALTVAKYKMWQWSFLWKRRPRDKELNKRHAQRHFWIESWLRQWRMHRSTLNKPVPRRLRTLKRWYFSHTQKNTIRMSGCSGGRRRHLKRKWAIGLWSIRQKYLAQFLPDSDGYYGFFKNANWYMRRKRAQPYLMRRRYEITKSPSDYSRGPAELFI